MNGLQIGMVVGMVLTLIFVGFLIKELIHSIKESNEGKVSEPCELD
jgi:heme/copper-type cytochrome/quinol oxidase subunit 3